MQIFEAMLRLQQAGQRGVLVTVVESRGSTPRKPGARMLVMEDGKTMGTIGGGAVEQAVCARAAEVLGEGQPSLVEFALTAELAMCCGGSMRFFLEPFGRAPALVVFGGGHVGAALLRAAGPLEFRRYGVDDLPQNIAGLQAMRLAGVVESFEPDDWDALPFAADTAIVIATRSHALDQALLEACLQRSHRYLGVIGSRRKAEMQRKRLRLRGVPPEAVAGIKCPIGVDIGAVTPAEIAVAICAELVATYRAEPAREGGTCVSLLDAEHGVGGARP